MRMLTKQTFIGARLAIEIQKAFSNCFETIRMFYGAQ